MRSADDFYVFQRWLNAPNYAFGRNGETGVVPVEDKEAYWHVYSELNEAAQRVKDAHPLRNYLYLRQKLYSRDRGSRGHRPKDLWVSICFNGANELGHFPQVYAIASERGLEIGFAASISEDDYFDAGAKERNRTIVPFINSKLPPPEDETVLEIDAALQRQGGWHFNEKTRLLPGALGYDEYESLSELLSFLKASGEETGGGTVCRNYDLGQVGLVDLERELALALSNFVPLLQRAAPTGWDREIRAAQIGVDESRSDVEFAPASEQDGRKKVWAEVARRQGQGPFRRSLLEAYGGACAVSGTTVVDVLQAAHIRPYNGPSTNHVTNGILLRADLHTLFDLRLLTVDPSSMKVVISPRLQGTDYWLFNGQPLGLPVKPSCLPNLAALAEHFSAVATALHEASDAYEEAV